MTPIWAPTNHTTHYISLTTGLRRNYWSLPFTQDAQQSKIQCREKKNDVTAKRAKLTVIMYL